MKYFLSIIILISVNESWAQNIGINTTIPPRYPLSFAATSEQKISLWDNGNAQRWTYGMGVVNKELRLCSEIYHMGFGYGSSDVFTEKFRFTNEGYLGINNNNPGFPVDVNGLARMIQKSAAYMPLISFHKKFYTGIRNDSIFGMGVLDQLFPENPTIDGLNINMNTGNVGLKAAFDNNKISTPLTLNNSFTQKISLYPGATGNVGVAVQNSKLMFYGDNPNADVAFGYDQYSTGFAERFAVKPTGALAIVGNTGSPGQAIRSSGSGSQATWSNFPSTTNETLPQQVAASPQTLNIAESSTALVQIPGLTTSYTMAAAGKVKVDYQISTQALTCAFCGDVNGEIVIDTRTGTSPFIAPFNIMQGMRTTLSGKVVLDVPAGTNYIDIYVRRISGPGFSIGSNLPEITNICFMIFERLD